MKEKADIGVVGLAVMGENLVLNLEGKGFTVSVYNYLTEAVRAFMETRAIGRNIQGAYSLQEFVSQLQRPRKILLMIRAGEPVDEMIANLLPLLESGDLLIDGGNSHYADTERRMKIVEAAGLLYLGCGVSGGEEGALNGPSLMQGGSAAAWPLIKPIFQAIAARTENGIPCCEWVGEGGAGHFVKMVHNGIEYGDMQLIAEAYHIMKIGLGMSNEAMAEGFEAWDASFLKSYLIQITAKILRYRDEEGLAVLDLILDKAGQKGTGKWAVQEALEEGVPLTLVAEAVLARALSAMKEERSKASLRYENLNQKISSNELMLDEIADALYASKIFAYAQGFMLMRQSAQTHAWNLNYGRIALLWQGGCIIRSAFLAKINEAFENDPDLGNLLLDPYFEAEIKRTLPGLRKVASAALLHGIPAPCMSSALAFFDAFTADCLPANLLQAQRDYFGAHTYERLDRPAGEHFHTNWSGKGGQTASTVYNR
ncbi:MAG: decarboxylating NADP(+)-dependent phosphogluconate dehydrogenase [Anaerolineaceae bacterium]|nr:decarboxylating NADP(+)-dependent phosphogluconate dehydrogenase [Anaerolineaceae bacterium]